jgi:hypothetical protein
MSEEEVKIAPCLRCASNKDITFKAGKLPRDSGGGVCNNCGERSFHIISCTPSREAYIEVWNKLNDIDILISNKRDEIARAEEHIEYLESLRNRPPNENIEKIEYTDW